MDMIKIGFIVNNLVVGGVSKVLIDLCNHLPKEKFEIHLLVLSSEQEMLKQMSLNENVKIHTFKYDFNQSYSLYSYLKNSFYLKGSAARAQPVIEKALALNLAILHFHTLPRQLVIGILARKKIPHLKLVFTDHLVRFPKGQYRLYQKNLLAIAYNKLYRECYVITVSKAVFDNVMENKLIANHNQIKLLPNSIKIENYRRSKNIASIAENRFIYVARINHHKGQDTLIEAWKLIKNPNKGKLFIVGPDESDGRIPGLAKNDHSIVFTGSISNINEFLDNSTVAIFPSQQEGLPISLLEKMAYELPVICSNIPELTSIIEDQKHGLHFELDNIDQLAEKLEYAINHKNELIEMGKNARIKVEKICQENDPVSFHEELYFRLANTK